MKTISLLLKTWPYLAALIVSCSGCVVKEEGSRHHHDHDRVYLEEPAKVKEKVVVH